MGQLLRACLSSGSEAFYTSGGYRTEQWNPATIRQSFRQVVCYLASLSRRPRVIGIPAGVATGGVPRHLFRLSGFNRQPGFVTWLLALHSNYFIAELVLRRF